MKILRRHSLSIALEYDRKHTIVHPYLHHLQFESMLDLICVLGVSKRWQNEEGSDHELKSERVEYVKEHDDKSEQIEIHERMGRGSRTIHQKFPTEATVTNGMKAYSMLLARWKGISEILTSDTDMLVGACLLHSFLLTFSTKLRSLEKIIFV